MSWLLEAIDLESGKALLNANKKPTFVRPNMRYARVVDDSHFYAVQS